MSRTSRLAMLLQVNNRGGPMTIDGLERGARIIAVAVGTAGLELTVVGPATWWGLLGLLPLAMGVSGW